jgi:hypothetical protein
VEFVLVVTGLVDVVFIGVTGFVGTIFLIQVLVRLTVTSNPVKVPVSIDIVSCLEFTSIESLVVSPTLKASICPTSVTVDIRHVAVEEEQLVLGDMETCASPRPVRDWIMIVPLSPFTTVHRIAPWKLLLSAIEPFVDNFIVFVAVCPYTVWVRGKDVILRTRKIMKLAINFDFIWYLNQIA